MKRYSNMEAHVASTCDNHIINLVNEAILDFLLQTLLIELIWVCLDSKVAFNLADIAQTLKTVILQLI